MNLIKKSVLNNLKIMNNGILIEEIPFVGKINIRGNPKDKEFLSKAGSVLDTLIPLEPNTKVQNNKFQLIWLSPNEWLISFFDNNNFDQVLNKLNNELNAQKTAITDVSENKTIIRLEGLNVILLLRKFMILDIEKILSTNSKVAQTIFVQIPILIIRNHKDNLKQSYDIHVNRSHASYLRNLLNDGCNQITL